MVYRNILHTDSIEEKKKNYKKVSKEDIMNLAKKIKTMKIVVLRDKK